MHVGTVGSCAILTYTVLGTARADNQLGGTGRPNRPVFAPGAGQRNGYPALVVTRTTCDDPAFA
jgi:hypothetical protein